jgi:hypothetical protein
MSRRVIFPLLFLALIAPLSSCDRSPPPAVTTAPSEPVLDLDLKPLTPLLPNRPTHVAVDNLGNIYWAQETDREDDTLFVIGQGEIPRATQLSVPIIAVTLGVPGARGNIQGIATGPEGEIYFYFNGALGRRTVACLGQFSPKTSQMRILADTDAIAAATEMGRSLPLARASIVSDGRIVWAWLRHSDAWAIFRFDAGKLPREGPVKLTPAFTTVRLTGKPVELTREQAEISPAPEGALFLVDPQTANLLRIDATGEATVVRSLVGLPNLLSTPVIDREGALVLFAANAPLIGVKPNDPSPPKPIASFPSLLIFKDPRMISIDRDHVIAYPGFQIFSMRLKQLVPHAAEQGWISYDAGSGELLRVKIVERAW